MQDFQQSQNKNSQSSDSSIPSQDTVQPDHFSSETSTDISPQIDSSVQTPITESHNLTEAPTQSSPLQHSIDQASIGTSQVSVPPVTQEEKIYALIAYLPLLGLLLALLSLILKPDSAYVRLHARQGLLLSLLFYFSGIFAALFSALGFIGGIIAFFIAFIPVAITLLEFYSIYLTVNGVWWKIPVLGFLSDLIPVELFSSVTKEVVVDPLKKAKDEYVNRQENQPENEKNQNITPPTV